MDESKDLRKDTKNLDVDGVNSVDPEIKEISDVSFEKRQECYATAKEFEIMAYRLRCIRLVRSIIELLLPIMVFTSIGFLAKNAYGTLVCISVVIGAIQTILSTLFHVFQWDEKYYYYIEALQSNYSMADEYDNINNNKSNPNIRQRYHDLMITYRMRNEQDYKYYISEKLKVKGRKAAFSKYNLPCPVCNIMPSTNTMIKCPCCGERRYK
ncbi:MAG: mobilome CxxCx(11)CxxC protein [Candidatus Cloacimonadota bacterium]